MSSLSRLYVNLEVLYERVLEAKQKKIEAGDLDVMFLEAWTSSMMTVFDEYGLGLADYPHEIYFLDLCLIFSAYGL